MKKPITDYSYNTEKISLLMLVCFLIYFFSFIVAPDSQIIIPGWSIISVYLIGQYKPKKYILIFYFGAIFLLFYAMGYSLYLSRYVDISYIRTVFQTIVLSSLIYCILSETTANKRLATLKKPLNANIEVAILVVISGWSFFNLKKIYTEELFWFRDVIQGNYLVLSDFFALFSIALISRDNINRLVFLSVFVLTLVTLILFGSRSSIILFFLIACFLFFKEYPIKNKINIIMISLLSFGIYFSFAGLDLDSRAFGRIMSLSSLSTDASFTGRIELNHNFVERVVDNPGCLLLPCLPDDGNYSHTILSLIEYFGLAGLSLILYIIYVTIKNSLKIYRHKFFGLYGFCLLSSFFSRSWVSLTFAVLIGFVLFFSAEKTNSSGAQVSF